MHATICVPAWVLSLPLPPSLSLPPSHTGIGPAPLQYFNVYTKGTDNSGGSSERLGWNAGFSQCNTRGEVNDVDFVRAVVLWQLENLCTPFERRCFVFYSHVHVIFIL